LVFENDDDDTEALTMFFFLFDEDDVDESRRELLLGVFFFVILFVVLFLFELNDICDARVVHSIDSLSLFFSLLVGVVHARARGKMKRRRSFWW
jgi:hypothetical protein